eukprot:1347964-Pyramimonas_sp.AAC.2
MALVSSAASAFQRSHDGTRSGHIQQSSPESWLVCAWSSRTCVILSCSTPPSSRVHCMRPNVRYSMSPTPTTPSSLVVLKPSEGDDEAERIMLATVFHHLSCGS